MNLERVRSILGVWAPMAIGLFIIVTSINFFFTASLTGGIYQGDLESWRLVCSAGAFFVGGVLMLSTYGRYRKTQEARRGGSPATASSPPPAAAPHDEGPHDGDRDDGDE